MKYFMSSNNSLKNKISLLSIMKKIKMLAIIRIGKAIEKMESEFKD